MNIQKIIGLVALAIAVVAAFVSIPYVAAILVLLGIPIGLWAAGDAHVRVLCQRWSLTCWPTRSTQFPRSDLT